MFRYALGETPASPGPLFGELVPGGTNTDAEAVTARAKAWIEAAGVKWLPEGIGESGDMKVEIRAPATTIEQLELSSREIACTEVIAAIEQAWGPPTFVDRARGTQTWVDRAASRRAAVFGGVTGPCRIAFALTTTVATWLNGAWSPPKLLGTDAPALVATLGPRGERIGDMVYFVEPSFEDGLTLIFCKATITKPSIAWVSCGANVTSVSSQDELRALLVKAHGAGTTRSVRTTWTLDNSELELEHRPHAWELVARSR